VIEKEDDESILLMHEVVSGYLKNSTEKSSENTATFVKILFTDPVNSETTIYRERESRTDLV
jgi:hypothetical protein